jgi:hypothetical protein
MTFGNSAVHKHECDQCGVIWQHAWNKAGGNKKTHKCPKCRTYVTRWYEGPKKADYIFAPMPRFKTLIYRLAKGIRWFLCPLRRLSCQ